MSVKIRLKRLGKVRVPQYRIVIVDSRKKRDGKVIEEIGKYHPKEDPSFITVVSDRAQYWLGVGAQPSEAVAKLLKITGDWQQFKGISGTEGTLKTAEPKRDKLEIFNEALKEAHGDSGSDATTAKKAPAKKSAAKKASETPDTADKAGDESGGESGGEAAEKTAEKPAKKSAAATADAEPDAPVPADETPAGAAADAEAAADKADGKAPETPDTESADN